MPDPAELRFRSWLRIGLTLGLASLLGFWGSVYLLGNKFDQEQFERIQLGMTPAEVEANLGPPTYVQPNCWQRVGSHTIPDRGSALVWQDWDHQISVSISDNTGRVVDMQWRRPEDRPSFFENLWDRTKRLIGLL